MFNQQGSFNPVHPMERQTIRMVQEQFGITMRPGGFPVPPQVENPYYAQPFACETTIEETDED